MEISILNNFLEVKKKEMKKIIIFLEKSFLQINIGRANPYMFNDINVKYHNGKTALKNVSNILSINYKTLIIQPWDNYMLPIIEKAIIDSNIGFTPLNNGKKLIITIPNVTEEARKELVKKIKSESEISKINIRNIRKEANIFFKKIKNKDLLKNMEIKIQKITNKYIEKIDNIFINKKTEIMNI